MTTPDGTLTAVQLQIMEVVWTNRDDGVIASEIWQQIATRRSVVRTTILNQVDRLEKRGWLRREPGDTAVRYFANLDREATEERLATEFVNDYFRGSFSSLVGRLFSSSGIDAGELRKVREMIDKLPRGSTSVAPVARQGEAS